MAPVRIAVPVPLHSLDPSERASGSRKMGQLEKRGRGNEVCTRRGGTPVAGPGVKHSKARATERPVDRGSEGSERTAWSYLWGCVY